MLKFEIAKANDYLTCFELVKSRIDWMNKLGLKHWNTTGYLEVYPLKHYLELQNKNELYVLKEDEEIVSFGALLSKDQRWNDDSPAYYLHHLTSKVSNKHYGKSFIIESIKYSIANNKKYFRLDSSKDYPKLEEYYKQFGFKEAGECEDGNYLGILRQIDLNDKKALRKFIKTIDLSNEYIKDTSKAIEKILIESREFQNAKTIFIYLAGEKEVQTDLIINKALTEGKRVYVPKCDEDNMYAVLIDKNTSYTKNKYGLKEPIGDEKLADDIDLAIVPCLSLGKDLSRLGHGKGYYDKYLKGHPCFKIGLCFNELLLNKIPMDTNDIYMDEIISA